MEKVSISEVFEAFRKYNKEHNIKYGVGGTPAVVAVVVFKQSNFNKPYTEEQRSYRFDNLSGKAFFEGMIGNSIFMDCIDGTDQGVRYDAYRWEPEYCYFEKRRNNRCMSR